MTTMDVASNIAQSGIYDVMKILLGKALKRIKKPDPYGNPFFEKFKKSLRNEEEKVRYQNAADLLEEARKHMYAADELLSDRFENQELSPSEQNSVMNNSILESKNILNSLFENQISTAAFQGQLIRHFTKAETAAMKYFSDEVFAYEPELRIEALRLSMYSTVLRKLMINKSLGKGLNADYWMNLIMNDKTLRKALKFDEQVRKLWYKKAENIQLLTATKKNVIDLIEELQTLTNEKIEKFLISAFIKAEQTKEDEDENIKIEQENRAKETLTPLLIRLRSSELPNMVNIGFELLAKQVCLLYEKKFQTYNPFNFILPYDFHMKDSWVPLTLGNGAEQGTTRQNETVTEELLQEIYDTLINDTLKLNDKERGVKRRKLLTIVRGEPFSGKTTLTQKIAYDWATKRKKNRTVVFEKYDLILITPLRDVPERRLSYEKILDMSIAYIQELSGANFEYLDRTNFQDKNVLILLDGYDEERNSLCTELYDLLQRNGNLKLGVDVLVTSRLSKEIKRKENASFLEITGFSTKEQKEIYIERHLRKSREIELKTLLQAQSEILSESGSEANSEETGTISEINEETKERYCKLLQSIIHHIDHSNDDCVDGKKWLEREIADNKLHDTFKRVLTLSDFKDELTALSERGNGAERIRRITMELTDNIFRAINQYPETKVLLSIIKQNYEMKKPLKTEKDGLLDFIKLNRGLDDIAQAPMILTFICLVYQKSAKVANEIQEEEKQICTIVKLYHETIELILSRWSMKQINKSKTPQKLQHENKNWHTNKKFKNLGHFAYEMLVQPEPKYQFNTEDFKKYEIDFNYFIDNGLVYAVTEKEEIKSNQKYQFVHLTFQEYLAALYVVQWINDETNKEDVPEFHELGHFAYEMFIKNKFQFSPQDFKKYEIDFNYFLNHGLFSTVKAETPNAEYKFANRKFQENLANSYVVHWTNAGKNNTDVSGQILDEHGVKENLINMTKMIFNLIMINKNDSDEKRDEKRDDLSFKSFKTLLEKITDNEKYPFCFQSQQGIKEQFTHLKQLLNLCKHLKNLAINGNDAHIKFPFKELFLRESNITSISLHVFLFSDEIMLEKISVLQFNDCTFEAKSKLLNLPPLKSLIFNHCDIKSSTNLDISRLPPIDNLEHCNIIATLPPIDNLEFSFCKIAPATWMTITGQIKKSSIHCLKLKFGKDSFLEKTLRENFNNEFLNPLRACENVKEIEITIGDYKFRQNDMLSLSDWRNLHSLSFWKCTFEFSFQLSFTDCQFIKMLIFSECIVKSSINLSTLPGAIETVPFNQCRFESSSQLSFTDCPRLKKLLFRNCEIKSSEKLHIETLPIIDTVEVDGCTFEPNSQLSFANCPSLKYLKFSQCEMKSNTELCFTTVPAIDTVEFYKCEIDLAAWKSITNAIASCFVKCLKLSADFFVKETYPDFLEHWQKCEHTKELHVVNVEESNGSYLNLYQEETTANLALTAKRLLKLQSITILGWNGKKLDKKNEEQIKEAGKERNLLIDYDKSRNMVTKEHRELLERCRPKLIKQIVSSGCLDDLIDHLGRKDENGDYGLTPSNKDIIRREYHSTEAASARIFLEILSLRGEKAFDRFIDAIRATNHRELIEILNSELPPDQKIPKQRSTLTTATSVPASSSS